MPLGGRAEGLRQQSPAQQGAAEDTITREEPAKGSAGGGRDRALERGGCKGEKTSPAMLVLNALDLAQVWYE